MQDPYLIDHLKYTLEDIVTVLNNADMPSVMKNLHTASWSDDPVIHFYETFLAAYNPDERERLGVYYTPAPVVAYIMASVQEFLTNLFNKQDGLADRNVTLLDPASGTLTFPIMGIRLCHNIYSKQGRAGAFPSLVREHILNNFFAFELLLAPYVIGHFKATISLQELGCSINDERFKLFLTNALETKLPSSQNTLFPEIEDEGKSASKVKEEPVFVIVGNPPYSVSSDNKSDFIEDLMKAYKIGLENERNI
jgi:predicted helicase